MFKKVELWNFRKYERFSITCRERNILVGPNNAGKSSILDALRLFADVQRFASRRIPFLKSYADIGVCATYDATNSIFSVTIENICRNYSSEYAEIIVTNENGSKLHININPEKFPEVFIETENKIQKNKNFFSKCFPERVIVVPTLSQFEEGEKPNDPEYVRSVEYTRLAARNFRNIWRNKNEQEFAEFRELVSLHWQDIDIQPPELNGSYPPQLQMYYQEKGRHREIYWSGFGFQAWLQMMTQFLRGEENDVLVLDEPDVYLHADLQRRLFHISKKRFEQIFIATHSAEIMNEANAADVILIKPGLLSGSRITSEAGYRSAHALLGSSENADFARLVRAKRIIAFEGNDRTLFKRFENKIRKGGVLSDPDTLSIKIGGYEHWRRVDNLAWMFKELFGMEAKIVAIFDRDYRSDEEISDFEQKLSGSGVLCRVLRRKEIENYLIEIEPLCRAIREAGRRRDMQLTNEEIVAVIDAVAESHREDCLIDVQSFASKYSSLKRDGRDPSTILKSAKMEFDSDWVNIGFKKRIGGKQFIFDLNSRLQNNYGFNISHPMIIDEFDVEHIDSEIKEIIEMINCSLS
ncbi:ATP-dependent nuclease [Rhizobium binxianense]